MTTENIPPPADDRDPLLARCAILPRFDRDTYDGVLRQPGDPTVDELVDDGLIESSVGPEPYFRIQPGLREEALGPWRNADRANSDTHPWPPDLQQFAGRLTRHLAEGTADRVSIELRLNPVAGTDSFVEAFRRARQGNRLEECQLLIRTAAEAVRNEPARFHALESIVNETSADLRALQLGEDDNLYLDRDLYLERSDLQAAVSERIDKQEPVVITGSAGQGKSTLLRWVVQQHYLADVARNGGDRRFAACAVLDFDDRTGSARDMQNPAAVLLEIARQFDEQLPNDVFRNMVSRLEPTATYLRDRSGPPDERSERAEADVIGQFEAAVNDGTSDRPVLIVLDTFEDVVLRTEPARSDRDAPQRRSPRESSGGAAQRLLAVLQEVRRNVREKIQLVVSGRGTAAEPQVVDPLGDAGGAAAIEVGRFTRRECFAYLKQAWAPPWSRRHEDLAEVLWAKTSGTAWDLELGAELVADDPDLTPEQLRAMDIEAVWAANRVLLHISEPLRWVVLLGSVARRLDAGLLEEVVRTRVLVALDRTVTAPLDEEKPGLFRRGVDLPSGPDLWDDLNEYRKTPTTSWVFPDQRDGQDVDRVVRLDPHLRRALNRLATVEDPTVHSHLAEFLERRAATAKGASWYADTLDGLHHRTRATGQVDGRRWHAATEQARHLGRYEWVVGFADDILDRASVPKGVADLLPALRVDVLCERAWARTIIARRGEDGLWPGVRADRDAAGDGVGGWRGAAVDAALACHDREFARAVTFVDRLGKGPTGSPDRYEVALVAADAAHGAGLADRERAAWESAIALSVGSDRIAARRQLVDLALLAGDVGTAGEHAAQLPDRDHQEARVALAGGRPGRALEIVRGGGFSVEHAEALIALCRPGEARVLCDEAIADAPLTGGARQRRTWAAAHFWRGVAFAALLAVDDAIYDWIVAARAFRRLDDDHAAATCSEHLTRLFLRDIGNLVDAEEQIALLSRTAGPAGSRSWVRCRLLQAELAYRQERYPAAQRYVERVFTELGTYLEPVPERQGWDIQAPTVVETVVAAFAFATAPDDAGVWLDTALGRIADVGARLSALRDAELLPAGSLQPELLDRHFPIADVAKEGDDDTLGWRRRRLLELQRACGDLEQAQRTAEHLRADGPAMIEWHYLAAAERIADAGGTLLPADLELSPSVLDGLREEAGSRLLLGAYVLRLINMRVRERGDIASWQARVLRRDDALVKDAIWYLNRGPGVTGGPRRITRWHLRLLELRRDPLRGAQRRALDAEIARYRNYLGWPGTPDNAVGANWSSDAPRARIVVRFTSAEGALVVRSGGAEILRMESGDPLVDALRARLGARTRIARVLSGLATGRSSPLPLLAVDPAWDHGHLGIADTAAVTAQLPWELATAMDERRLPSLLDRGAVLYRDRRPSDDRAEIRVLQETLHALDHPVLVLDGDLGPLTRDAMAEFRSIKGLPAGGGADRLLWAALRAAARAPRHTQQPVILDVDRLDVLAAQRDDSPPVDVLQLTCGIDEELTGGQPELRFDDGVMSPSQLAKAVTALAEPGRRTPQIVLDVLGDNMVGEETLRRLLLRNAFAAALVDSGATYAVLATGLAAPATAPGWTDELHDLLLRAPTLDAVASRLHATAPVQPTTPGGHLPWTATALFTAVHPDRLPTLWRPRAG